MNPLPEIEYPERLQLITELKKKVPLSVFDREVWGLIWLSDIGSLRKLVSRKSSLLFSSVCGASYARISATWSTSTPFNPSETAKRHCLDRDGNKCVITEVGEPVEVAHICPYPLMSSRAETDAQITFWGILSNFWTSEQIDSWKSAMPEPDGTEACPNLICLSPSIHKYWGKAFFALKPIEVSADKKAIKVQFCWLPVNQDRSSLPLETRPSLQTTGPDTPGNNIRMLSSSDESKVETGREIVLKTDDPVARPLPSWELLTMQWNLQRLASLTGAAEPEEVSDSDDYATYSLCGSSLYDSD